MSYIIVTGAACIVLAIFLFVYGIKNSKYTENLESLVFILITSSYFCAAADAEDNRIAGAVIILVGIILLAVWAIGRCMPHDK